MNVYLFELDSVRNTVEEIEKGQEEMFRQILLYGNDVVLTFNQLTDSRAFLMGLYEEKSFTALMKLIALGKIKVSQFGHIRTPSQYLQESIGKWLDGNGFYFSGLPLAERVTREDMEDFHDALAWSDPQRFTEKAAALRRMGQESAARRADIQARYVRMILLLSRTETANIPPLPEARRPSPCLTDFIGRTVHLTGKAPALPPEWPAAAALLSSLLTTHGKENTAQNRSQWYGWITAVDAPPTVRALAEAAVDLCYNYTLEASISEVCRRATTPHAWPASFAEELLPYWDSFTRHAHRSHTTTRTGDTPAADVFTGSCRLPDWEEAASLIGLCYAPNPAAAEDSPLFITLNRAGLSRVLFPEPPPAAQDVQAQQQAWFRFIRLHFRSDLLFAALAILLFLLIEAAMNALQNRFDDFLDPGTLPYALLALAAPVFSVLLFSLVSSLLETTCHIPDILDSVQSIGKILRFHRFMKREERAMRNEEL